MRLLIPFLILMLVSQAVADEPVFVARTAAGKEYSGQLARLDEDWALEVGKGARHKIASGDLIDLRQKDVATVARARGAQ